MGLDDSLTEKVRRREALIALGGLGAGGLWAATRGPLGPARAATDASAAASCVLAPEVTEGPYWIANSLTRRNITAGQTGIPLLLRLVVEDSSTCEPISGADVELWHANRLGAYSGVNGNTKRYLRGHQKSDSKGLVLFRTIYPGWYRGRTPHIHVKVHVGGSVEHTGQLFFSNTVSKAVYETSLYKSHGQPDRTNAADSIYADAGGARAKLKLTKRSGSKGYLGAIALVVQS
jgi:protocatechuate 3,4-dioxygenase beta subunit